MSDRMIKVTFITIGRAETMEIKFQKSNKLIQIGQLYEIEYFKPS